MSKVVCFGEIMLRLTTPLHHRLNDAPFLDLCFGGAEGNVAVQIAGLGVDAAFVSRMPENELADRCLDSLKARGVNVSAVVRGGSRVGTYFVSPGFGVRPTTVLYDRQHSAMSEAAPGMFDWDAIFSGAQWFHFSGITPALGAGCAALCREACEAAKMRGLRVSFDLNFRSKLWSTAEAAAALQPLMRWVDLCVCGADEAVSILGADASDIPDSLRKIHGFSTVAMTRRGGDDAHQTQWQASLTTESGTVHSREYSLGIVDRIGTGDSFTGALIFSILRGDSPQSSIDFAAAAGAWKHTIPGDWNRAVVAEIEDLARGKAGGSVKR
jgi:2-dehydro-3-deoxygluconokinase